MDKVKKDLSIIEHILAYCTDYLYNLAEGKENNYYD